MPRRGFDIDVAADQPRPFAHADEAEALGAALGWFTLRKPAAVVFDDERQMFVVNIEQYRGPARLCVLVDVMECFLQRCGTG